jgi:hypothetical protein
MKRKRAWLLKPNPSECCGVPNHADGVTAAPLEKRDVLDPHPAKKKKAQLFLLSLYFILASPITPMA